MFRNYIKIAFRNLKREPGYSFINIVGLALGLACSMIMLLWVQDELSYDRFHKNADNIYRLLVQYPEQSSGELITMPKLPSPLAQAAKDEIPEVVEATRVQPWVEKKELIKYDGKVFYEDGITSYDPAFLKMFSFPLVKGDLNEILSHRNDVVITEAAAKKYFGDEEPIGKVLNWNNWQLYTVKGVLKDTPQNSHIKFSLLTSFENEEGSWPRGFTWFMFNRPIYLQLQENANVEEVNRKLTAILKKNNPRADDPAVKVLLQPLTDIHLTAGLTGEFYADVRDIKYIYIYSIIALFILSIACINFINLSTARSAKRAKEVGLRKTIGANRLQVFKQYMSESFLLVFLSQIVALIFVELFLPTFNELSGKALSYNIFDARILLGSVAIILLAGALAGSYPAVYLSGFNPISVLKGTLKAGTGGAALRKVLVVTQFSLSIILILGTIIVAQQLHFLKNKKLGFEKENIVYLPTKENAGKNYDVFKNRLLQNPNILSVAAKDIFPTGILNEMSMGMPGTSREEGAVCSVIGVGYDYFKTLNLEIPKGRAFLKEHPTDTSEAVILNEEAVSRLGLTAPVGQKIRVGGEVGTIIGVIKNANFRSLHHKVEPQVYYKLNDITSNEANLYGVILVRINGRNIAGAIAAIESAWREINPDYPLEINFLDARYDQLYKSEQQISTIVNYFTFLAILISCLGLFGLASFTAEQRTKEIGVRKVLGASVSQIVILLSKEFSKLVLIALVLAAPVSYYFMNKWLENFAYHTEIGMTTFLLAGLIALAIAGLTVSFQAVRAAFANPVESLRYE